jgi:cytochrome o ubiquinol oxidase subunit 1
MFGKLTIEALPLYSAIAATGALVTVGGAFIVFVVVTWLKAWKYLWTEWLTSVDHKRIGVMYIVLALIMLMRGFVDAIMMRAQQAMALNNGGYLPPEHFDQIFSSHGTIMIFFMAMPFMTGLMNIAVPLQIGTRDVAFPFLNSLSLWLTSAGAALVMVSLVIGKFSTAGWTGYPPYSGIESNPGVGVDYWVSPTFGLGLDGNYNDVFTDEDAIGFDPVPYFTVAAGSVIAWSSTSTSSGSILISEMA